MSNQSTAGACFLCGGDSSYKKIDFGNRRAYDCKNPDCGDYRISNAAMERLRHDGVELKESTKQMANRCVGTDKVPEISVSDDQSVVVNLVDR